VMVLLSLDHVNPHFMGMLTVSEAFPIPKEVCGILKIRRMVTVLAQLRLSFQIFWVTEYSCLSVLQIGNSGRWRGASWGGTSSESTM
jgi:hypothetical protein